MQHCSDAGRGGADATLPSPDHQERFTARDQAVMRRALELAERGRATVAPNPLVGCVIADGDEIVGEGWHQRAGQPHAEVLALRAAGARARGATAYVTLEPCGHHGRTPPCTEALIAAGIAKVVAATSDPNPQVRGRGLERLRAAGLEVEVGLCGEDARAQNAAFIVRHTEGRPWVRYKTAMTLDGKIATRTGQSRWITGEESRALVQHWRSESTAVAVGVSTVLLDDPRLTARIEGGRTPHKVVFDSVARTPPQAALFQPDDSGEVAAVTIFVGPAAPKARVTALQARGATVVASDDGRRRPSVVAALRHLVEHDLSSVLLEGGGTLAWSFIEARAVDRVAWFIGPLLLGGKGASPLGGLGVAGIADALTLEGLTTRRLGPDLLIEGDVRYPAAAPVSEAGAPAEMEGGTPAGQLSEPAQARVPGGGG